MDELLDLCVVALLAVDEWAVAARFCPVCGHRAEGLGERRHEEGCALLAAIVAIAQPPAVQVNT